jgi:hypothetical protein
LYNALADGTVSDTDMFRQTLNDLEKERDEYLRLISTLDRRRQVPWRLLTRKNLERFTAAMFSRFHDEDNALRKEYIRQFVDRVEVDDDEVRIYGSKAALANAIANPDNQPTTEVPGFVQEWWWTQSGANPSLPDFPVKQGKYRVFFIFEPKFRRTSQVTHCYYAVF